MAHGVFLPTLLDLLITSTDTWGHLRKLTNRRSRSRCYHCRRMNDVGVLRRPINDRLSPYRRPVKPIATERFGSPRLIKDTRIEPKTCENQAAATSVWKWLFPLPSHECWQIELVKSSLDSWLTKVIYIHFNSIKLNFVCIFKECKNTSCFCLHIDGFEERWQGGSLPLDVRFMSEVDSSSSTFTESVWSVNLHRLNPRRACCKTGFSS